MDKDGVYIYIYIYFIVERVTKLDYICLDKSIEIKTEILCCNIIGLLTYQIVKVLLDNILNHINDYNNLLRIDIINMNSKSIMYSIFKTITSYA